MRKPNSLTVCCALLSMWCSVSVALALSSDSDQPIEIEADYAELDEKEGKTIYTGNVIVTQGSIRMTGDTLRVNFDENNKLEEVFLEGQPAIFKQRPDDSEVDIVGRANLIEYHSKDSLLFLIEEARVTRGAELFEGHRINYDTERSIITARSLKPSDGTQPSAGASSGRVRIVIPPKQDDAQQ